MECGVSYFGVRRLRHVQQDLEEMARQGVTYVVHPLTENDWRSYYETMRQIVQATRDAGLRVWLDPACLGYVFAGDDFHSDAVLRMPEAAQIDQFGRWLPSACPNQPAFQAFVRRWIDAAMDLGPDVLFWDEPHLFLGDWFGQPERWGCRCDVCRTMYRERYGEEMPVDGQDASVRAFQSDTVLEFLDDLLTYAKSKGAYNALTVLPVEYQDEDTLDWEAVAALPALDNLGTDPYPFPAYSNQPSMAGWWREFVGGYARRIVDLCQRHGLENHLWFQGFSVPAEDEGYLDEVIDLAAGLGITNVASWGFDGHRDMSAFICERPDEAWAKIGRGFRRLRGL